ncbi:MAG: sporulation protein YabP [Clostridia bacterium]|nr:sporulation protein YabP [Clostridia bacterium]
MEERKTEQSKHNVVMKGRDFLSASGVEDVESFDDDRIIAYTTEGQMTIKGADLKINRLSVEDGELQIEGIIDSVEYQDSHKPGSGGIFSKIFK